MSKFIIILSIVLNLNTVMAQDLYIQSLETVVSEFDTNPDSIIYLEFNKYVNETLPAKINDVSLIILDEKNLEKVLKQKKHISLLRITPISIDSTGSLIKLQCIWYRVSKSRKIFNFANKGSIEFTYAFDCQLRKYVLYERKHNFH